MELLNAVLIVTKCENAEQLKNLSTERKRKLAHSLKERVPSGLASIEEWNELLKLFMDAPPEIENKIANHNDNDYYKTKNEKWDFVWIYNEISNETIVALVWSQRPGKS